MLDLPCAISRHSPGQGLASSWLCRAPNRIQIYHTCNVNDSVAAVFAGHRVCQRSHNAGFVQASLCCAATRYPLSRRTDIAARILMCKFMDYSNILRAAPVPSARLASSGASNLTTASTASLARLFSVRATTAGTDLTCRRHAGTHHTPSRRVHTHATTCTRGAVQH